MLQFNQGANVENPREYEVGAVEHLQYLLQAGSPAKCDPRRENFYELDGGSELYYIYISPVSGNVVLLAKWIRQSQVHCSDSRHFAAHPA
jgi:hypothetical protein